jgi:hypothetical protein
MNQRRSEDNWTRLAASLYDGITGHSFLERVTVSVNHATGMGVTQWTKLDRLTLSPADTSWSRPTPQTLNAEYEREFAPHDPRIAAALKNFGRLLPCWRLVDNDAFEKSFIVHEWSDRKDIDCRWSAVSIWGVDDDNLGLLAVLRPRKAGPIQIDELRIVNRLRSHIRRAAQLHYLFREQSSRGRTFDDAWASPIRPVFLLGRGRRLLAANGAGHDLLGAGDVFQTRWGELTARAPRLLAALDNALAAARRFDLDIHPKPIAIGWPRFGGLTALKAEVMAIPGLSAELGLGERAEALVICREVPRRQPAILASMRPPR